MSELNPIIHAPLRLRLVAMLSVVDELEFARARDALQVSDSVLSKHVSTLADAGYVNVRKPVLGGRRITWLRLTGAGRTAYESHVAALRAIVDGVELAGP